MSYRYEIKYLILDSELEVLKFRLEKVLKKDIYQKGDYYTISSLYFDDFKDSLMKENFDGVDRRKKYRIRMYNHNNTSINLERKSKIRGLTKKESVPLTLEECKKLIKGQLGTILYEGMNKKTQLLSEIYVDSLKPKSIVEYERSAWIAQAGNVRITFDRNIRGTEKTINFLNGEYTTVPLLKKGWNILEVKFDDYIPNYIIEILEIGSLRRTAFSKYVSSRNKLL